MNVAIIKYNAGNIYSVVNALRRLGVEPVVTDDAELIKAADHVLFPGQGEASSTMAYLKERNLDKLCVVILVHDIVDTLRILLLSFLS